METGKKERGLKEQEKERETENKKKEMWICEEKMKM